MRANVCNGLRMYGNLNVTAESKWERMRVCMYVRMYVDSKCKGDCMCVCYATENWMCPLRVKCADVCVCVCVCVCMSGLYECMNVCVCV